MIKVLLLGSTGSIGRQTLKILENNPDFKVVGLACKSSIDLVMRQAYQFSCKNVACVEGRAYRCDAATNFYCGANALEEITRDTDFDVLINAVVGIAGFQPTLIALQRGKKVALANKETLVTGGRFVNNYIEKFGGSLVPIDSEHSALMQAVSIGDKKYLDSLIITASGGAMRDYPLDKLSSVTVDEVLAHPNWEMGGKITVDCSTMVNKAFEVIEAHYLFGLPYDKISAVIHRESIIHGMATFSDGTTSAILGIPNMELPIALALYHPNRPQKCLEKLDFSTLGKLSFDKISNKRYPLYYLIKEAVAKNDSYNVVINALDECAVEAFLCNKIPYDGIYKIIRQGIDSFSPTNLKTPQDVLELDKETRLRFVNDFIVG